MRVAVYAVYLEETINELTLRRDIFRENGDSFPSSLPTFESRAIFRERRLDGD